ncbi:MAG TPA: hypothetical protein VF272_04520 [Candidatus Saccharimonadia bacterium]
MDQQTRITGIRPLALAIFEGTLGLALGILLAVAVFIESAALQTALTNSLLQGLIFGLSASLLTLLLVPLFYFAIGFVAGYLHALLFNALAAGSKEMVVTMEPDEFEDLPSQPITRREHAMGFGERMPERRRPRSNRR